MKATFCGLAILALAGCGRGGGAALTTGPSVEGFAFTAASDVHEGKTIPRRFTCDGGDVSPKLVWKGVPDGTQELALVLEDPDAPGPLPYLHWFVYRVPATTTQLPEGAAGKLRNTGNPENSTLMQGRNYLGRIGYAGPNPPPGRTHRYFFQVFALDRAQDWPQGTERSEARERFKGHVLGKGVLVGRYKSGK